MGIDRTVRWKPWSGEGLDHLRITQGLERIGVVGFATRESDGQRLGTGYTIVLNIGWEVQSLSLWWSRGDARGFDRSPARRFDHSPDGWASFEFSRKGWIPSDPLADPSTFGTCTDVDLFCTPFTNTLPIRRLNLKVGERSDIEVMHFSIPDLHPKVAHQRYTRLSERRYLYEDATFDFSAELEVDEDGLVLDYPGLFRRVPD